MRTVYSREDRPEFAQKACVTTARVIRLWYKYRMDGNMAEFVLVLQRVIFFFNNAT